ncbi:MAG: restriction endonuclease subunit S [Lutibacter sp.]
MMDWKETTLGEIAYINPRESIKKGDLAKNVPMDSIDTFTRKVSRFGVKEFSGGTKFRNGDTLLARITPCLENGKTALVDFLDEDEIGFGSTEYIVIREKKGVSCNKFLYYLSISPKFRSVAIKAMTGTSGRQRVQTDMLVNKLFKIPTLQEQNAIANVLTAFDDKIELLQQQNTTIETLAQTIFKEWFGKYQVGDELPEGWRVGHLGKITKLKQGKYTNSEKISDVKTNYYKYPVYGGNGIRGYLTDYVYETPQVVLTCRGNGCGLILYTEPKSTITNSCMALEDSDSELSSMFIYFMAKRINFESVTSGSAQPQITVTNLTNMEIIIPNKKYIKTFDEFVDSLFNKLI